MQRTQHSPEAKAEALRLMVDVGLAEAARRTGIAKGTIASWAARTGTTMAPLEQRHQIAKEASVAWQVRKVEFGERLSTIAAKAADRLEERLDTDRTAGVRDLAATMAVLVDKAQLLTGGATARTETHVERTPEAEAEVAKVLSLVRPA